MLNTSKPTEVERNLMGLNRQLSDITRAVQEKATVTDLLRHRDDLRSVAATANNLRFVVSFNQLEDAEQNRLSKDRLLAKLEDMMTRCAVSERQVEINLDRVISQNGSGIKSTGLHKLCASLGIGSHLSIQWSAVSAKVGEYNPILHVTAFGANDRSGFKHDQYHIWVKPKARGLEISTGFAHQPPVDGWTDCANQANLLPALKQRFTNDGF